MDEKDLIKRIINRTKTNELVWVRNKVKNGIIFNCRLALDVKKCLILKAYLHNKPDLSYLHVKMNNGIAVLRIDLKKTRELYDLLSILDYKVGR